MGKVKIKIIGASKMKTILECKKCHQRWTRLFKDGDYIFKDTDEICNRAISLQPNCDGKLTIEEIWAPNKEIPEKEKELLEKWK